MVSGRPHNAFDTASYTKPRQFQTDLAAFLNFTEICFRQNRSVEEFYRDIPGSKSKMAKLAEMAVAAGPRAAIFEISIFLLKKLLYLSTIPPGAAWLVG